MTMFRPEYVVLFLDEPKTCNSKGSISRQGRSQCYRIRSQIHSRLHQYSAYEGRRPTVEQNYKSTCKSTQKNGSTSEFQSTPVILMTSLKISKVRVLS